MTSTADGALHTVDGRPILRFERRLAHPPRKVWAALTDPAQLAQWFPADIEGDRAPGATLRFVFREDEGPAQDGLITAFDPPHLLAFTWDADVLRFELHPDGRGCRLVFTHSFDDRPGAASFASGWTICLAALDSVLEGRPVDDSLEPWAGLHEQYVERFGLAEGAAHQTAGGWTVRFERQLTHPIDTVWASLTETDASAPNASGIAIGGPPPLPLTNEFIPAGPVITVDPPALLEYAWQSENQPAGRVRWELSQGPGGARLVLTQTVPKELNDQRPAALAAWHVHLERLAAKLKGQPTHPQPEERTEELRRHYAALT
ncbi:MAG: SRPBCC family protein [Dehalococcoidia bacterium]